MNNTEAKLALSQGKKLTHEYFTPNEWVKGVGLMYEFEDGCKCLPDEFWRGREDFPPLWKVIG